MRSFSTTIDQILANERGKNIPSPQHRSLQKWRAEQASKTGRTIALPREVVKAVVKYRHSEDTRRSHVIWLAVVKRKKNDKFYCWVTHVNQKDRSGKQERKSSLQKRKARTDKTAQNLKRKQQTTIIKEIRTHPHTHPPTPTHTHTHTHARTHTHVRIKAHTY